MRHCAKCGSEYQDWVKTCLDCGSTLAEGAAGSSAASGRAEDQAASEDFIRAAEATSEGEFETAETSELDDELAGYVDEYIDPQDFLTPQPVSEWEEPEEIVKRAELVSVLQTETPESVRRAAAVLRSARIKIYLTRKPGIFNEFYLLLVEKTASQAARDILKDTQNGYLIPIDPEVDDPELKDAPVINLDEKTINGEKDPILFPEDRHIKAPLKDAEEEKEDVLVCPLCDSTEIESKTSFFSRKVRLKCRDCSHQWQIEV